MKEFIERVYTDKEKEPAIIHPETGEIMDFKDQRIWIQTEKQREQSKQYFERMRRREERKMYENPYFAKYGAFVWAIYSVAQKLLPDIKPSSLTRLMFISTFTGYDGYICKNKNSPMSEEDIQDSLGLSYSESHRFISEMFTHKILLSREDRIYVNREFFARGGVEKKEIAALANQEKRLTRLYIDAIRDLYGKATPRSHKSLSYIFRIIPFVSREYNIVCHNPLETELEKVQPMTLGEFCDVIEYDRANSCKLFRLLFEPQFECGGKIKSAMRYVVSKDLSKNSYCMFINPRVYYAGTKLEYVEVLGQF